IMEEISRPFASCPSRQPSRRATGRRTTTGVLMQFASGADMRDRCSAGQKAEYTIDHLMKANGHEKIDILKMNIEGSEFSVLPEFMKTHKVCQLLGHLREIANNGYLLMIYEINAIHIKDDLTEYAFIHSSCLATYETHYLSGFIHS
ncbi:hypothetical protein PENTCL1PPCAC_3396, partial [Pristionchus entomophagus]